MPNPDGTPTLAEQNAAAGAGPIGSFPGEMPNLPAGQPTLSRGYGSGVRANVFPGLFSGAQAATLPAENAAVGPSLSTPRVGSAPNTVSNDLNAGPAYGPDNARGASALADNARNPGRIAALGSEVEGAPGVSRIGSSYSGAGKAPISGFDTGAPMTTEQANRYYQGQRIAGEARERQDEQQRNQAMNAQVQEARVSGRIPQAQGEKRVADFLARYGVVPGSVSGVNRAGNAYTSGERAGRAVLAGQAQAADQRLANLEGQEAAAHAGAGGQPRNYVQEAAALHPLESENLAAAQQQGLTAGGLAQQETHQKLALGDLAVHLQQHLNDLQTQATGTGPEADKARTALNWYRLASEGKSQIAPGEALGHFSTMVGGVLQRLAAMGQSTDQLVGAIPGLYQQWTEMTGLAPKSAPGGMSLQQFLQAAKTQGSRMSEGDLTDYYNKNYGGGQR
jgi:hypothetical protein